MLMIRLSRRGARKQPHYRIVVIEKDRARDGRSIEVVGTYNPRTEPATIVLKRDRVDHWVSKGAQLSDRVRKIVAKAPVTPAASSEPITPASVAARGADFAGRSLEFSRAKSFYILILHVSLAES